MSHFHSDVGSNWYWRELLLVRECLSLLHMWSHCPLNQSRLLNIVLSGFHRAIREGVCSDEQNAFKPLVAEQMLMSH